MRGTAKNRAGATSRMFSGTVSTLSAKFTVAPERRGLNTVNVRSAMWHRGRNESCWSPGRRSVMRAGGAGGVHEDGEVAGPREVHHAVDGARVLALPRRPQLEEPGEGHHLLVGEGVQAVHVVDDDLHHGRAPVAGLEDLVELLL